MFTPKVKYVKILIKDKTIKKIKTLFDEAILFKYHLPHNDIEKVNFSTKNEECFENTCNNKLVKIIYNSLIYYSYNDNDLKNTDYNLLLKKALKTKLKYNDNANELTKIKYGFYGEVLFDIFLRFQYSTEALIARGYFYNPLENAETKGYDSYHLIEKDKVVELWFGEVKFHQKFSTAIKSALSSIEKAISDNYFTQNIYAFENQISNLNIKKGKLQDIINAWSENPDIVIVDEIKKYDFKFIYPIMIAFDDEKKDYDEIIKKTIDHINEKYKFENFNLSFDFEVFFIFLPIEDVKYVKQEVIKCIEEKKPLL